MLVLSRKENESIVIDGQITVTVLEIHGRKVRLGFQAGKEVAIVRAELLSLATTPPKPSAASPRADESLSLVS